MQCVRSFMQVDVFATGPVTGNPVAVVLDAEGLTDAAMAAFARWTNLSETTFVLPPTDPRADYRLRIFTPGGELPFAGHPTVGSAHAWVRSAAAPGTRVTQECGVGLVPLRVDDDVISFAAPPPLRTGPVDDETLACAVASLGIGRDDVVMSQWVDNGPGWLGLVLGDAAAVLALRPDLAAMGDLRVGVIGEFPAGERPWDDCLFEARAGAVLGAAGDRDRAGGAAVHPRRRRGRLGGRAVPRDRPGTGGPVAAMDRAQRPHGPVPGGAGPLGVGIDPAGLARDGAGGAGGRRRDDGLGAIRPAD